MILPLACVEKQQLGSILVFVVEHSYLEALTCKSIIMYMYMHVLKVSYTKIITTDHILLVLSEDTEFF